jgi:serine protease Do
MSLHRTLLSTALLGAALGLVSPMRAADPTSGPGVKEQATPRETRNVSRDWNPRHTPVVDAVKRVRAAVVNIHSERTVQVPASDELFSTLPSQNRVNGMGTGIVIDPRGYIITNQHVVEDVNLIRVRLSDGTSAGAKVVARDNESDLALLKIDVNRPLTTMPLGTASDLMVGETVIAVGNAYGYEHTVTVGVVSALKRDVTLNKEISYKSLIQTDASINPGNSGGPLVNVHGELVGVNVAIRAGAQGIGFAIPVDSMIRVASDMLSIRKLNGTWHGIVGRDRVEVSEESERENTATSPRRLLIVDRIEANSPANKAGLQRGDVIVRIGDQPVDSTLGLERALLEVRAGDQAPILVQRQGKEQRLELVVETADRTTPSANELAWKKLGMRLQPVSSELVSRTNQQLHGGLAVMEVRPDGVAGKAGIQKGDILVGLHQWEMLQLDNLSFVLTHPDLASFNPIRFYIIRAGQVHRGWLQQVE